MIKVADFYISISRVASGRYAAEFRFEQPDSQVDLPPVRGDVHIDFNVLRQSALEPEKYGEYLGSCIFSADRLHSFYQKAVTISQSSGQKLRLRLIVGRDASELHGIRWETLRDADGGYFLASSENLLFSRFLFSEDMSDVPLIKQGNLKALVAVANPIGLSEGKYHDSDGKTLAPVDVDGEIERAARSLSKYSETTILARAGESTQPVTLDALITQMREGHQVIYLVCHGVLLPENPYEVGSELQPYLWLEKDDGGADVVRGELLAERIRQLESSKRPLLIVLLSCQSAGAKRVHAQESSEDHGALSAIGPRLVQVGVPAVVAMQDNIFMDTAAEFVPSFFQQMALDGMLERAVAAARGDIQGRPDWWVPVLFTRLKGGSIFLEEAAESHLERTEFLDESVYDVGGLKNPYPGLRSYTYEDRLLYGGRDEALQQAVEIITQPGLVQNLTFITGASGSGKSSFALAGLLPDLEKYYNIRHKRLRWAVFKPSMRPVAHLADALTVLGIPEFTIGDLNSFSVDDFNNFLQQNTASDQVNVLVIDQFEELFSQSLPVERDLFIEWLIQLAPFQSVRTHVVCTMRSDYLDELFNYKPLWNVSVRNGIELRTMSIQELKETIRKPLQTACQQGAEGNPYCKKRFERSLVDRLAEDAAEDATYLPLLQITLQELWNGGSLKRTRYTDLTTAIRQRAEKVYSFEDYDLNPPVDSRDKSEQGIILKIFLDLVNVSLDDDYRRDVRRRRRRIDLEEGSQQTEELIDDLIAARLLSVSIERTDVDEIETVDIIHESLIRNWTRLNDAVDQKRNYLKKRARFELALAEWKMEAEGDDYLLTGVRLDEAQMLDKADDIVLRSADAEEYFNRSLEKDVSRHQRSLMQRYSLLGFVGGALGFVIAYLITGATQITNTSVLLILSLYRLLPGAVAGAVLMFGFAFVRARKHTMERLAVYLISGCAGVAAFSLALLISALLNSVGEPLALMLIMLEGALWGFAAGIGTAWLFNSRLPVWVDLILVILLGGAALLVGELFGHGFRGLNSEGPSAWQIVLAGAFMMLFVLGAAVIADPSGVRNRSSEQ